MAKEHSKSQARWCKEKQPNSTSPHKKLKKHRRNRKATTPRQPTPLLQRNNNDDSWLLSEELLNTFTPIHNHFIGSLNCDTLVNVSAGIGTLAALLSLEGERGILPSNPYYGAYWLALNMIEALQFEIDHRQQLVATTSGAQPSEN